MKNAPIPLARPWIEDEEIEAVSSVVRSRWLVQGQAVRAFEEGLQSRTQRVSGVAVSSGTAALHLALVGLDVRPGDEVICPNFTWPSPAHALAFLGAIPVLVDVREDDWNLCPNALGEAISQRTRAIIVVDQFGNPARADEIREVAGSLPIIEDAACALGSRFADGSPCGSLGDVSCFSFHPRKVITTGEGGMCLTDDDELAHKLRALRNHGQDDERRFVLPSINYRMPELSAALGNAQLERLDRILEMHRGIRSRYLEALPQLQFQVAPSGARENVQTIGVLLPKDAPPGARDAVVQEASKRGVQLSRLSYALHELPSLQETALVVSTLSTSTSLERRGFALPCFAGMGDEEVDRVIEVISDVTQPYV